MRLILRTIGTILVLLFIAGVVEKVNNNGNPKKIVPIGGARMSIPSDTPKNVFAVTRAAMEGLGYEPWYQSCIMGQIRSLLTPSQAERFTLLDKEQRDEISLNLMLKAEPRCEQKGRDTINPDASPEQLYFVKAQSAKWFPRFLAKEGFSRQAQNCVASKIRYATDEQILELANGSEAAKAAVLLGYLKRCR